MNQRILKKQIGVKSTMKICDYYSARIDEDRPEFLKDMKKYVEAKTGNQIFIISLEPPKLKRKKKLNFIQSLVEKKRWDEMTKRREIKFFRVIRCQNCGAPVVDWSKHVFCDETESAEYQLKKHPEIEQWFKRGLKDILNPS